ncbi:MAG: hypothetical protein ACK53V_12390, partial [Planctomycetota bacterium]
MVDADLTLPEAELPLEGGQQPCRGRFASSWLGSIVPLAKRMGRAGAEGRNACCPAFGLAHKWPAGGGSSWGKRKAISEAFSEREPWLEVSGQASSRGAWAVPFSRPLEVWL